MIAEGIELFRSTILSIDDESLVFGNIVGLAKVLEDGGNLGLETLAENGVVDVFEFLVLPSKNVEGALSMARIDVLKVIDGHPVEESAALAEFLAKIGRVGVSLVDRFPSPHAPAKPHDDHVRPGIAWTSAEGGRSEAGQAATQGSA
jgi:hypothetical protein